MTVAAQPEIVRAAYDYLAAGWSPIPVLPRSKNPGRDGWQTLRVVAADVPDLFSPDSNIGLLLGARGEGLVDADLDCREAVALAPYFLPVTGFKSGRPTNPQSHYWFRGSPLPEHKKFEFDGECLVELRSVGQTVAPPSLHDKTGEQLVWHEATGELPTIAGGILSRAVAELAAATLLVRQYPKTGVRHDFALALAGFLLRRGWPLEKVRQFVQAVATAAKDEELEDRLTCVETTVERLALSDETIGGGRLREILGSAVFSTFCEWLGFSVQPTVETIEADQVPEESIPLWPATALDGDYIGELTFLLTNGTGIPPQFVREEIILVLAAIADGKFGFPRHPDLPLRRYLAVLSEHPQSGKGESWKRIAGNTPEGGCLLPVIRGTVLGDGTRELQILNGTGIGSGQFLAKELEANPYAICVWDELSQLLQVSGQQCSTVFSSLKTCFESNSLWTGSLTNKKHGSDDAHLSVLMQGTRSTFREGFALRGATGDGLLSRFVIAFSAGQPVVPEWEQRDLTRERQVMQTIREMLPTTLTIPTITEDARERMRDFALVLNGDPEQPDFAYARRLHEHAKVDVLMRCIFSGSREITLEMVNRSIAWGEHQLALRRFLWTPDAKNAISAMAQLLLRRLQKGTASRNDLRRAANVDRDGTFEEFNRCLTALTRSGQVITLPQLNRKGQSIYALCTD
ncbi:MAG TPA: bifunctional DNA primase/polymerase [Terriglobales bacterium]|nr:bifunctional DNA primase/polymerase [Terriglobales bacterium]